jgi:hypothetical protein
MEEEIDAEAEEEEEEEEEEDMRRRFSLNACLASAAMISIFDCRTPREQQRPWRSWMTRRKNISSPGHA